MNAYELADIVDKWAYRESAEYLTDAATMLRQQHAEIEALKISLSGHSAEILSKNDETLPNGKYEPVAWMLADKEAEHIRSIMAVQHDFVPEGCVEIPLYAHPAKEQSTNERIEMLKEMIEKIANPVGWIGYQEGHLVSFLKTQEQVNSFLTATDPTGRVEPVYTHPVKELTDEEIYALAVENGAWISEKSGDVFPDDLELLIFARAILRKAQEK